MMRIVTRTVLVASVLAASLAPMGASAQVSHIMYFKSYFSDATLTTRVGFRKDSCFNGRVSAGPVMGTATPYFTLEEIGACAILGGGYD